jgi:hypothetical protein
VKHPAAKLMPHWGGRKGLSSRPAMFEGLSAQTPTKALLNCLFSVEQWARLAG